MTLWIASSTQKVVFLSLSCFASQKLTITVSPSIEWIFNNSSDFVETKKLYSYFFFPSSSLPSFLHILLSFSSKFHHFSHIPAYPLTDAKTSSILLSFDVLNGLSCFHHSKKSLKLNWYFSHSTDTTWITHGSHEIEPSSANQERSILLMV